VAVHFYKDYMDVQIQYGDADDYEEIFQVRVKDYINELLPGN